MNPKTNRVPRGFSTARVQEMVDPLMVRVERVDRMRGTRQPIPLEAGGQMTREDLLALEEGVRTTWGSGFYEANASDGEGRTMTWDFSFEAPPAAAPPPPQAAFGPGFGPVIAPRPWPSSWAGAAPPTSWGQQPWPGYGYPPGPTGPDPEVAGLRREVAEQRQAAQEARFTAERTAADARHSAEMATLRDEIRALREGGQKPAALEAEMARRFDAMDARLADKDSADRHRAEMTQMQANFDRQIAELRESGRRADPMVEALKAAHERSAEAMKEVAREHGDALKAVTAFVLKPTDYQQIMTQAAQTHDVKPLVDGMKSVFDMQQQVVKFAMENVGEGQHPALQLVGQGLDNATRVFRRYIGMRAETEMAKIRRETVARAAQEAPPSRTTPTRALAGPATQPDGGRPAVQPPTQPPAGRSGGETAARERKPRPAPARPTAPIRTAKDWFGPAESFARQVQELAGSEDGTVENVVEAVVGGVQHFAAQKPKPDIAAFRLLEEGKYGDFFHVLLPDTPTEFRLRCAEVLGNVARAAGYEPPAAPGDGTAPSAS